MKIPADIIQKITDRKMTARSAAAEMGITEQYLCRLLKDQQIIRKPSPTKVEREKQAKLTTARREHRKQLLAQVNNGSKTVTAAAKDAGCSTRTIYRHLPSKKP